MKERYLPMKILKQRPMKLYVPRQPRLRKRRWVSLTPRCWSELVSEQGVMQCQMSYNGYDIFVLRICRDRWHQYYFTVVKGDGVTRCRHDCAAFTHEAKAFNDAIGFVGVTFRAAR
jgi:hypothetical protein